MHPRSHVADWLSHACFLPQTPGNASVRGMPAWGLHPHQFRESHHIPSVLSLPQSKADHPFLDQFPPQAESSKGCMGREVLGKKVCSRNQ